MEKNVERLKQRPFYVMVGVLLILIAVAGFGPISYKELVTHQLPPYPIVHIHALLFVGWLIFFFVQVFLAASERTHCHIKVGKFLAIYAVILVSSGLAVTINRYAYMSHRGEVEGAWFLTYFASFDMLAFSTFFVISLLLVKWPEAHKRMMVISCTILLYPAITRLEKVAPLISHPTLHGIKIPFMILWMLPVIAGLMHDLISNRRFHPANIFGIASLLLLSERGELLHTKIVEQMALFFQHTFI